MLTDRLRAVVGNLEQSAVQLPADVQDRLAEELESALKNALRDAHLSDPVHLAVLRALAEEAMREPSHAFPSALEPVMNLREGVR